MTILRMIPIGRFPVLQLKAISLKTASFIAADVTTNRLTSEESPEAFNSEKQK